MGSRAKLAVIDEFGVLDPEAQIAESSLPLRLSAAAIRDSVTEQVDTDVPLLVGGLVTAQVPLEVAPLVEAQVDARVPLLLEAQVPPRVEAAIAADPTVANAAAAAAETAVTNEISGRDMLEGSDSRLPVAYPAEDNVDVGWADTNERLAFGIDIERGVTIAPVVESKKITATDSIDAPKVNGVEIVTVPTAGAGLLYGIVDANDLMWEPTLVDENGQTPQWVLDRMAARMPPPTIPAATTYKPVTNALIPATERNIVSGPNLIGWGHSMLAGAGSTAGQHTLAVIAQETGLTYKNGSVGGESSSAIVARQGGLTYMLSPVGGAIPASGGVEIPNFPIYGGGTSWPLLQGSGTDNGMAGTLAGVPGVITLTRHAEAPQYVRDSRDVYTFTRTTPGSVVPVTRPAPFYYSFSEARRGDIAIFWLGRNNIQSVDKVYWDLKRAIQHLTALDKRFLILAETNGTGEYTGTATHTATVAYNKKCEDEFGRRFVDTRRYIIDYGLADAGITPTAQDNADIAGDTIPASFRVDSVHMNTAGYTIVGKLAAARLRELGWVI